MKICSNISEEITTSDKFELSLYLIYVKQFPLKVTFDFPFSFILILAQRRTISRPFASTEGLKIFFMLPFTFVSHKNFPFAFGLVGKILS